MSDNEEVTASPPEGERIAKLLARAGIASRREVERMIEDGRVKLDGVTLTTAATIIPTLAGVTVDDKPVAAAERTRLFAFHKPPGLITAERDPAGRPTIYNALINALPPGTSRQMPVGRLDFSTEGLLLLTNDGEFKRQLELPATGVPRTYRARVFGTVTQTQLEELAEGVTVDGMPYGRIIADMERRTGRNGWVEMTLTEGKNREVRRVLEHLGLEVSRLIRTAYGPFHLGELPRGAAVEIRNEDLERFRASLKGDTYQPVPQVRMAAAAAPKRSAPPQAPAIRAAPRPAPARINSDDKPKYRPETVVDRRPARSKPYADASAKPSDDKPRRTKPYAQAAGQGEAPVMPGGRRAPRKWGTGTSHDEGAKPAPRSGGRGGDTRSPHPSGPQSSGPRSTGPRSTGPRSSGPGPSGPRPTGPRSSGPKRGDR